MKMNFNDISEKTGDYIEKERKSRLELQRSAFREVVQHSVPSSPPLGREFQNTPKKSF